MTIKSLTGVQKKLYEAFNMASEWYDGNARYCDKGSETLIQGRIALGTLGSAIAAVERELRVKKKAVSSAKESRRKNALKNDG